MAWDIVASPEEKVYFTFLHLADGSLSEDELTAWFTRHAVPLQTQIKHSTNLFPTANRLNMWYSVIRWGRVPSNALTF